MAEGCLPTATLHNWSNCPTALAIMCSTRLAYDWYRSARPTDYGAPALRLLLHSPAYDAAHPDTAPKVIALVYVSQGGGSGWQVIETPQTVSNYLSVTVSQCVGPSYLLQPHPLHTTAPGALLANPSHPRASA